MKKTDRNAIILAAGTSSRFVPLSAEIPKGLLKVKGEIMIERQIRQLKDAGIRDITVVTGYMAEKFEYLREKMEVRLVHNEDYDRYNNISSVVRVLDNLGNTFICSSDNYFPENVFLKSRDQSFYSSLFANGDTKEYCLEIDENDNIRGVTIGGHNAWYMIGHVFLSENFSRLFKQILNEEYLIPENRNLYWEDIYIKYIDKLPKMKVQKYHDYEIKEFDTLDELREFDKTYISDTRSKILKKIASQLQCTESELSNFKKIPNSDNKISFSFFVREKEYVYDSSSKLIYNK
ncbi:NTP transferase domain-containing protein [Helicobacter sp.]|uniref:NTP transferase domain-containing protein n=1 Tax=Helicobacter sp. TaxID=218 RepID=UPI0019C0D80E|nr:NTP transferase domain-containing protein [Helicobacter sp.]MBD5164680.1 NTP transferase domain-containing protein [Helicobacter sp.]